MIRYRLDLANRPTTATDVTPSAAVPCIVYRAPRGSSGPTRRAAAPRAPEPDGLGGDLAFEIEVECSAGTYIRTLAADIGAALGGGAHLHRLRRTAVGPFGIDDACALEALGSDRLLPLSAAVRHLDRVEVGTDVAADVATGKVLTDAVLGSDGGDGPWAVLDGDGGLLAVYERYGDGTAKPSVVLVAR